MALATAKPQQNPNAPIFIGSGKNGTFAAAPKTQIAITKPEPQRRKFRRRAEPRRVTGRDLGAPVKELSIAALAYRVELRDYLLRLIRIDHASESEHAAKVLLAELQKRRFDSRICGVYGVLCTIDAAWESATTHFSPRIFFNASAIAAALR